MNLSQLSTNLSHVFFISLVVFLLGAFLWWITRIKIKRVPLPTVKILNLPKRKKPLLKTTPPPWLSFLFFILLGSLAVFLSLQPGVMEKSKVDSADHKVHIFVDVSPSVSAIVSLDELRQKLSVLVSQISSVASVTISNSYQSADNIQLENLSLDHNLKTLNFHKSGLRLGESISRHLKALNNDVDSLVIVSDRDRHSWTGFNWRFLEDKTNILFYDISKGNTASENVFIKSASFIKANSGGFQEWELVIARTGVSKEVKGAITVERGKKSLAQTDFVIPEDEKEVFLNIHWVSSELSDENQPISWTINTQSNNSLKIDDTIYTLDQTIRSEVAIMGGIQGENYLRDSSYHFSKVLELLGFKPTYVNDMRDMSANTSALKAVFFDGVVDESRFCPDGIVERDESSSAKRRFILVPSIAPRSYHFICKCFMTMKHGLASPQMKLCGDINHRETWIDLLVASGAQKVGGSIDNNYESLAFTYKSQEVELTSFTVPLNPNSSVGIGHSDLPYLIKTILNWQNVIDSESQLTSQSWMRFEDINQYFDGVRDGDLQVVNADQLNVPISESFLNIEMKEKLPPELDVANMKKPREVLSSKIEKISLPMVQMIAIAIALIMLIESLMGFFSKHSPTVGKWLMIYLAVSLLGTSFDNLSAKTDVIRVGDQRVSNLSFVANEISNRTSITLGSESVNFASLDQKSLESPWLWVKGHQSLLNERGEVSREVLLWIRKGGFLIIEGDVSKDILDSIIIDERDKYFAGSWQTIPPDHELMRSFYLLDSLPSCENQFWRGYHVDSRLAILVIPFSLIDSLEDSRSMPMGCEGIKSRERNIRAFVNILMVALTTDYKKDQIHLPEILKRLR